MLSENSRVASSVEQNWAHFIFENTKCDVPLCVRVRACTISAVREGCEKTTETETLQEIDDLDVPFVFADFKVSTRQIQSTGVHVHVGVGRGTHTHTDTHTHTHTNTHKHTHRQTHRHTHRHTDTHRDTP